MSGRKISNGIYNVDTDWQDETESKDVLKYGLDSLDFSEMNTIIIPKILAGSSIDIDGVFYRFDGDEVITGAPSDGTVYVIIAGDATAVASFTNVALPAYDFNRKGYYAVGGERYVLKVTKSGGSYTNKIQLSKNYFGRNTEFSGNITQLSGIASFKATTINGALTVGGNITQTSGVTTLLQTTINTNNNRIAFSSTPHTILFGSDAFTDSRDRYRVNFNDITGGVIRFDAKGGQSVVWGSYNDGGALLSHMTLNGSGRLILDGIDNGLDLAQFAVGTSNTVGIGYGRMGQNGYANAFILAQKDNFNANNYGLFLSPTDTLVNAPVGGSLHLRVGHTTTIATLTDSAMLIYKPVTMEVLTGVGDTLYRPTNTNGSTVIKYIALNNSSNALTNYASFVTKILSNTAGAETGSLTLRALLGGSAIETAIFSGSAIELKKPVTITGNLNVSTYGLFGGAIYDGTNNLNVLGDGKISGALTADTVNTGYGDNDVVPEDFYNSTVFSSIDYTLPIREVKQNTHQTLTNNGGSSIVIYLPLGSYSWVYSSWNNGLSKTVYGSGVSGDTSMVTISSGSTIQITYTKRP